jgi:hypothetical protein
MGSLSQVYKQKTSWHKVQNWSRNPPPQNAGCTKLVQKVHTALSWHLL